MGAENQAGASAPAIESDHEAAQSWDAFKYIRVLGDEDAEPMAKMDAAIGYAALVSHLTEEELVELAGGGSAPIAKVMDVVASIIAEAAPKN